MRNTCLGSFQIDALAGTMFNENSKGTTIIKLEVTKSKTESAPKTKFRLITVETGVRNVLIERRAIINRNSRHSLINLLVWLAWTDLRSSNCCYSDYSSWSMSMRSWRHLRLYSVVALEMKMGSYCELLFVIAVVLVPTGQFRRGRTCDWMEMRCIALLIFREALAAVEQTPRSHHVAVTRRGSLAVVFGGTLHCACPPPRCVVHCAVLSLTEKSKSQVL